MTLGIVNINSYVTSELPIIKNKLPSRINCLVTMQLVADKFLLYIVNKHQYEFSLTVYLLLLVMIMQCIIKIGLVTENFIPNYQSLFFKLIQLAPCRKITNFCHNGNVNKFCYRDYEWPDVVKPHSE